MQCLIWALEEIEKGGNQKAAEHARSALDALREARSPASLGLCNSSFREAGDHLRQSRRENPAQANKGICLPRRKQ